MPPLPRAAFLLRTQEIPGIFYEREFSGRPGPCAVRLHVVSHGPRPVENRSVAKAVSANSLRFAQFYHPRRAFICFNASARALSFEIGHRPGTHREQPGPLPVRGQKDTEIAEKSKYQVYRRLILCSAYARSNGNSKIGQV